jgi:hypothetical protein
MAAPKLPIVNKPPLHHRVKHIMLSAKTDTKTKKKSVEMFYTDGQTTHKYIGHPKTHGPHQGISVDITDQESLLWESEDDSFVVFLKDPNPFFRTFPASSIPGTDGIHRVSSGPIRQDELGARRDVHFLIRFTGKHRDAIELDPHMTTFP